MPDKPPAEANYRVWWKMKKRRENDPFDGHQVVVGVFEAGRLQSKMTMELGDKYNVGMFRIADDWGASPASEDS